MTILPSMPPFFSLAGPPFSLSSKHSRQNQKQQQQEKELPHKQTSKNNNSNYENIEHSGEKEEKEKKEDGRVEENNKIRTTNNKKFEVKSNAALNQKDDCCFWLENGRNTQRLVISISSLIPQAAAVDALPKMHANRRPIGKNFCRCFHSGVFVFFVAVVLAANLAMCARLLWLLNAQQIQYEELVAASNLEIANTKRTSNLLFVQNEEKREKLQRMEVENGRLLEQIGDLKKKIETAGARNFEEVEGAGLGKQFRRSMIAVETGEKIMASNNNKEKKSVVVGGGGENERSRGGGSGVGGEDFVIYLNGRAVRGRDLLPTPP